MKVTKQNGIILVKTQDLMFVITPSKDKGYKLTEINSNNKCYSFNDTTLHTMQQYAILLIGMEPYYTH